VLTASHTFDHSNLSGLNNLNLSGTKFAVEGMGGGGADTANSTFTDANLSGLNSLNLDGTVFATAYMTPSNLAVATAESTFFHSNLSGLDNLNLRGAIFAAPGGMTGGVWLRPQKLL
jgi:uncharacterized protein YjbI with pentapeptide repeats